MATIEEIARACVDESAPRDELYRALLAEPLLLAETRVQSLRLGAPVPQLFAASRAIDGARRFEPGALFPVLRGAPGALLVIDGAEVALDAGEVAALALSVTPDEDRAQIATLVSTGKRREAARRLSERPLYTLGHPQGGIVMFERELPAFLGLRSAEKMAQRLVEQTGDRVQHGLVAASELFKNAARGKLFVLVEPGPDAIRFRPEDFR